MEKVRPESGLLSYSYAVVAILTVALFFVALAIGRKPAGGFDTRGICMDGSNVEGVYLRLGTVYQDYGRMMQICSALESPFEHIGCTAMSQNNYIPMSNCDLQRLRLTELEQHVATLLPQVEDACRKEPDCLGILGTLQMR